MYCIDLPCIVLYCIVLYCIVLQIILKKSICEVENDLNKSNILLPAAFYSVPVFLSPLFLCKNSTRYKSNIKL